MTTTALFNRVVGEVYLGNDSLLKQYGYNTGRPVTEEVSRAIEQGLMEVRPAPNVPQEEVATTPETIETLPVRLPYPLAHLGALATEKGVVLGFGKTINGVFVNELFRFDGLTLYPLRPQSSAALSQPAIQAIDVETICVIG